MNPTYVFGETWNCVNENNVNTTFTRQGDFFQTNLLSGDVKYRVDFENEKTIHLLPQRSQSGSPVVVLTLLDKQNKTSLFISIFSNQVLQIKGKCSIKGN